MRSIARGAFQSVDSLLVRVRTWVLDPGVGTGVAETSRAAGEPGRLRYDWILL